MKDNKVIIQAGEPVFKSKNAHLLFNPFHHDRALDGFDFVISATELKFTCDKSIELNDLHALTDYSKVMHQGNRLNLSGKDPVFHLAHDRNEIVAILDERYNDEIEKVERTCQERIETLQKKIADAQREIDSLNRNGPLNKGVPVKEELKTMYDGFISKMNNYLLKQREKND